MTYIDGYVIPISEDDVEDYRVMAEQACELWMDHGAIDYKECLAEDLDPDMHMGDEAPTMRGFPGMADLAPGETVIFAWIAFDSREHRDEVNAAVMQAFEEASEGEDEAMPFDTKRMAWAGFDVIVDGG